MFSYRRESDDVADVRGRSGGAGVDYAVCRDDCGLGAGDSAALRRTGNLTHAPCRRAGEKPDGGRAARVPRGLRRAKASPLWVASRRASVTDDRSPPCKEFAIGVRDLDAASRKGKENCNVRKMFIRSASSDSALAAFPGSLRGLSTWADARRHSWRQGYEGSSQAAERFVAGCRPQEIDGRKCALC